jgi:hypothetical protein
VMSQRLKAVLVGIAGNHTASDCRVGAHRPASYAELSQQHGGVGTAAKQIKPALQQRNSRRILPILLIVPRV